MTVNAHATFTKISVSKALLDEVMLDRKKARKVIGELMAEKEYWKHRAETLQELADEAMQITEKALNVSNGLIETSHAALNKQKRVWDLLG